MGKKGFMGLFIQEEVKEGGTEAIDMSRYEISPADTQAYAPEINTTGIISIEEIYANAEGEDLKDLSKSIFKVEEIRNVLPANLPNEAKKQSALGMMAVSGLNLDDVIYNTTQRESELIGVLLQYSTKTTESLLSCEEEIATHEAAINELKEKMTSRTKLQEDQKTIIEAELIKIKTIKDFII